MASSSEYRNGSSHDGLGTGTGFGPWFSNMYGMVIEGYYGPMLLSVGGTVAAILSLGGAEMLS